MIPATFPNWGERSWLYDKSLQYVMSLDLLYRASVPPATVAGTSTRLPLEAIPPDPRDPRVATTYCTSGPLLFRGNDRIEREVPEARLVRGHDGIALTQEGAVELDGRLLLEVDSTEPIALAYQGTLTLEGGSMRLMTEKPDARHRCYEKAIHGTAFVATRQEVAVPKYRWLSYNQFVGIGRAKALIPQGDAPWLLTLSFDLYLGL